MQSTNAPTRFLFWRICTIVQCISTRLAKRSRLLKYTVCSFWSQTGLISLVHRLEQMFGNRIYIFSLKLVDSLFFPTLLENGIKYVFVYSSMPLWYVSNIHIPNLWSTVRLIVWAASMSLVSQIHINLMSVWSIMCSSYKTYIRFEFWITFIRIFYDPIQMRFSSFHAGKWFDYRDQASPLSCPVLIFPTSSSFVDSLFLIGIRYGRQLNSVSFCFRPTLFFAFDTSNHSCTSTTHTNL